MFEAFNITDQAKNSLQAENDGTLYLALASEKRRRGIGQLIKKSGKTHYLKKVREEHRFRKTDSWGIHWEVMNKLDEESYIGVRTELGIYRIKVSEAKEKGEFLWFKNEGFERQFFIPVENWNFERQ